MRGPERELGALRGAERGQIDRERERERGRKDNRDAEELVRMHAIPKETLPLIVTRLSVFRKSSGDGAPKLQVFCPLSWSNVS